MMMSLRAGAWGTPPPMAALQPGCVGGRVSPPTRCAGDVAIEGWRCGRATRARRCCRRRGARGAPPPRASFAGEPRRHAGVAAGTVHGGRRHRGSGPQASCVGTLVSPPVSCVGNTATEGKCRGCAGVAAGELRMGHCHRGPTPRCAQVLRPPRTAGNTGQASQASGCERHPWERGEKKIDPCMWTSLPRVH
ncbi:hypothetical protein BS78_01G246300 [Paspalum vaginatum]|nr:hypothetical protein BS78_01G246300 [Paspalum vaginatum]